MSDSANADDVAIIRRSVGGGEGARRSQRVGQPNGRRRVSVRSRYAAAPARAECVGDNFAPSAIQRAT